MKVLITGGAGFIGSHTARMCVDEGYQVSIVDNFSSGLVDNIPEAATVYSLDVRDDGLDDVFAHERPDFVIHLAAQIDVRTSMKKPAFDAEVNIVGTLRVLECSARYAVKKVIYASSAAVYGTPMYLGVDENHPVNPISGYGISKYTPERYIKILCEACGVKFTILRYANVYGFPQGIKGEGGVVSVFLNKLLNGEPVMIYGDGNQTRDFIYVKDVAYANICALRTGDNEIINVGSNTQTSVNKLFWHLGSMVGTTTQPVHAPRKEEDIEHSRLDNKKAILTLGWSPRYDIQSGLTETVQLQINNNKITKGTRELHAYR